VGAAPEYSEAGEGGWGSEWNKKKEVVHPTWSKGSGVVVNNVLNALEDVLTSRTCQWWFFMMQWALFH
jgi:hypothetical protein